MRARTKVVCIVILAVVFFMAVPMVSTSSPGAANICVSNSCTQPRIHFTQSLDCYLLGAGPGQWIGVYYFDGGLGVGCGPLVV